MQFGCNSRTGALILKIDVEISQPEVLLPFCILIFVFLVFGIQVAFGRYRYVRYITMMKTNCLYNEWAVKGKTLLVSEQVLNASSLIGLFGFLILGIFQYLELAKWFLIVSLWSVALNIFIFWLLLRKIPK